MATSNFYIKPEDGWVAISPAAVEYIRVRSNTPKHAFFVTSGTSAPAANEIGYKVDCASDFYVDVVEAGAIYYARVAENLPGQTRIDVFYIEGE